MFYSVQPFPTPPYPYRVFTSFMRCLSRGVSVPRSGSGSSEFCAALELYSAHSLEEGRKDANLIWIMLDKHIKDDDSDKYNYYTEMTT